MNTSKSLDFGYELEDFREAYRKHHNGAEPSTAFVVELLAMQASVIAEQEAAIVEAVEGLIPQKYDLDAMYETDAEQVGIEFRNSLEGKDYALKFSAYVGFNEAVDKVLQAIKEWQ